MMVFLHSKSEEATGVLSKQVQTHGELLQQMMASVNALCSSLDGSLKNISARLDNHEERLASSSSIKPKTTQRPVPIIAEVKKKKEEESVEEEDEDSTKDSNDDANSNSS